MNLGKHLTLLGYAPPAVQDRLTEMTRACARHKTTPRANIRTNEKAMKAAARAAGFIQGVLIMLGEPEANLEDANAVAHHLIGKEVQAIRDAEPKSMTCTVRLLRGDTIREWRVPISDPYAAMIDRMHHEYRMVDPRLLRLGKPDADGWCNVQVLLGVEVNPTSAYFKAERN